MYDNFRYYKCVDQTYVLKKGGQSLKILICNDNDILSKKFSHLMHDAIVA